MHYTYKELHNLSKEKVIEYDNYLRALREKAKQKNDKNEYAWLSRSIDWTERLLKHKNFDNETTGKTNDTNEKK